MANSKSSLIDIIFRLKDISGELGIIIAGKILSLIFNILGLKWVTYLVEPTVFGQFTLILSYIFIIELLFGVLAQGIGRYYFLSKERKEYNILKKVFYHFLKFIGSFLMGLMMFVFAIVSGVSNIISLIQNSERQRVIVSLHEMLDKVLKFGLAGIFILVLASSVKVLMLGYVVAVVIIACSQLYFYNKTIRLIFHKEEKDINYQKFSQYKNDILKYSTPFLVWTIFYWVQINSDKWLIDSYFSKKEVGLYQIINQYGFQLINMATGMLSLFMLPILFKKATKIEERDSIIESINLNNKVSKILFLLFLFFVPFTFLIHKTLFNILVSPEFTTYSYLFPFMVFAGGCFAVAQLLSTNYLISFSTKLLIAPKIFISIIGICVNLFCIKYYGLLGLVVGILLTNLIYLIWMFIGGIYLKRNIMKSSIIIH